MVPTMPELTFTPVPIPVTVYKPRAIPRMTNAELRATPYRKRAHAKNKTKRRTVEYMSRPFIAWDGEGVTRDDGSHDFILFAGSDGTLLKSLDALPTVDLLDALLASAVNTPRGIHVLFGGGYDFNMILADLPKEHIDLLYHGKVVRWNGYKLQWRPGKLLWIARGKVSLTLWDVISFFQCSFVNACAGYIGADFPDRTMIEENKLLRSTFTVDDLNDMIVYNQAELRNLVTLMVTLRAILETVNLRPQRWDGPGAIATALLRREDVKRHRSNVPNEVSRASRHAYAGGRFEVLRYGHVNAEAYEIDINSAYPSAFRHLPSLSLGQWNYHTGDPGPLPFALYHVIYTGHKRNQPYPGPLWMRHKNGAITYPLNTRNWYWSPEVEVAREYVKLHGGKLTITEAWAFTEDDPTVRPFGFITELFEQRRQLKAEGNAAHVGIKLALNSLYGKSCQQVGWSTDPKTGAIRIPTYHQLEWAGYATSHCRATMLRAVLYHLPDVIAFETDAVFTSTSLPVQYGTGIGEFESTTFSSLTYIQSGLYFGDKVVEPGASCIIAKTRGVNRGELQRDTVVAALSAPLGKDQVVTASLTRFTGAGLALAQDWDKWRRWITISKVIQLDPQGKRAHFGCKYCTKGGLTLQVWHLTICPYFSKEHSAEFPIEWINPDPNMTELSDMRQQNRESDYDD